MNINLRNVVIAMSGIVAAASLPCYAQDTCDDFPQLSSCNITPVGVCDAAAASGYVIEEPGNNWLVLPVADDPGYPDACSYADPGDAINPIKATAKDDTNNLQCALDFAAAARTSEEQTSTISLEKGRYCLREALVGLDFSGTIHGAGMHQTTVDIDDPVQRDENGHLNGQGGFRRYTDVVKSVVDPQGNAIDLHDVVTSAGDQAGVTKARRYKDGPDAAIVLANNRFASRQLRIEAIHFNVASGTQGYTDTIHGYAAVANRPDSISSIVSDAHVLGGQTVSQFGNSSEFDGGCAIDADWELWYNGASWYEEDTGVDLEALDPETCLLPIRDQGPLESPRTPRNCPSLGNCMPYAYDLDAMPEFDTTFTRVKATARNNTHNGLYYFISDRNLTFDVPVSEFGQYLFRQPVKASISMTDSVLKGLGSVLVGTIMDFSDTPLINSTIELRNNTIGEFKEAGETYACGRLWEGLDQLSGSEVKIRGNTIKGCQGGMIKQGYYVAAYERGLDSGSGTLGASAMPIPLPTTVKVYGNDYQQGPVRVGRDQPVTSFLYFEDVLNNNLVEEFVGLALPSLQVRVGGNWIKTTPVVSEDIDPYRHSPIIFIGLTNSAVGGNVITGAGPAAITMGPESWDGRVHFNDSNNRVIWNELSGYEVLDCDFEDEGVTSCGTGSPEQTEAAGARIWLGPHTAGNKVIGAFGTSPDVGDLGQDNIIEP
jgi:hypothetical protein